MFQQKQKLTHHDVLEGEKTALLFHLLLDYVLQHLKLFQQTLHLANKLRHCLRGNGFAQMLEGLGIPDSDQCAADEFLRLHQKAAVLANGGKDLLFLLVVEFRQNAIHCALKLLKHVGHGCRYRFPSADDQVDCVLWAKFRHLRWWMQL